MLITFSQTLILLILVYISSKIKRALKLSEYDNNYSNMVL